MTGGARPPDYDTEPYIDRDPALPAAGYAVWCVVAVTSPHLASERQARGPYLDGDTENGVVTLGCGVEEALTDLGLPAGMGEALLAEVGDVINTQLLSGPHAVITYRKCQVSLRLISRPADGTVLTWRQRSDQ